MEDHGSDSWSGERDGLVGRDPALSTLQEMLGGGGRTAVLAGIPGAGKTSLLSVVGRCARADGWQVLSLACHTSDQDLAFGALIDLLSAAAGAESALERVIRRVDDQPPSDPLRLRLEVLDWLESLSERAPVLVLVDDAHWCDPSSLSVLGFVARRLAGTSISLLVSTRLDVAPEPLADQPRVSLTPLADDQARVLLRQAGIELGAVLLPSVVERAAGNPLALLELGRSAAPGSGQARVPSSVEAAFGHEVSALPAATRRVLLLAAACDGDLAAMGRVVEPTALVEDLAPAESSRWLRSSTRRCTSDTRWRAPRLTRQGPRPSGRGPTRCSLRPTPTTLAGRSGTAPRRRSFRTRRLHLGSPRWRLKRSIGARSSRRPGC